MGRDKDRSKRRRADSSDDDHEVRRHRSRSRHSRSRSRSTSPPREKSRRERTPPNHKDHEGGIQESLSVEETNRLRAELGLAPLDVDDGEKVRDAEDGVLTDKIVKEDGMEFRHRKADNWADKKRETEVREKLEQAKKKRQIYSKVLKSKGLADDSDEEDAASFVARLKRQEEEKKKAAERARLLDEMDEEFGVNTLIEDEKAKQTKKKARDLAKKRAKAAADTAGLIVGHDKEVFLSGSEQILVLEDKSVLDEGDEVLVNPNLMDAERTSRNVELKKRKGGKEFEDELDEWGNPKDYGVLSKYDEELEGAKRKTFRLDESGEVDVERDREAEEMRRRLMMAGKTLVSLDDSNKFNRASEFYTQEEMISFRKVKKEKKEKKIRKRKGGGILKADDLVPDASVNEGLGSRNGAGRRAKSPEDMDTSTVKREVKEEENEDGEIEDGGHDMDSGKWKSAQQKGDVDLEALRRLVEREVDGEEESDDDDFVVSGVDIGNVILDDDAEDELQSVIDRARRLKQMKARKDVLDPEAVAKKVHDMISTHDVKIEVDEESESYIKPEPEPGTIMIDSTTEYCRNIGDTYKTEPDEQQYPDMDEDRIIDDDAVAAERLRQYKENRKIQDSRARVRKGGWQEASASTSKLDSDDEDVLRDAEKFRDSDEGESDGDEVHDVLGEERDVTKGVGAMLKLAAEKGYLTDPNAKKNSGESLDHLKNKRYSQMESAKFDIEEKYTKKLEKMGTTGRGPTVEFAEKRDYKPEINIMYVDKKGREMEPKDAFRELSWKFHGKAPGKKQYEKRMNKMDQKEMMKQMNSSDTPLGTLSKQLKKQEQLQTPYLVLSGNNSHNNFKKE